jgi:hypothetical protein
LKSSKDLTAFQKCERLLLLTAQFHELATETLEKKLAQLYQEAVEERNNT